MESDDIGNAIAHVAGDPDAAKLGFNRERWRATGEFVPGYRLTFPASSTGRYSIVLTEVQGSAAYWTDESGVIRVGAYSGAADKLALSGTGLSPSPEQRGVVAAVLEFFMPTVQARRLPCCEGYCQGFCTSSCDSCPPAICCNVGYTECVWCCRAIDYPWQCAGYCGLCD